MLDPVRSLVPLLAVALLFTSANLTPEDAAPPLVERDGYSATTTCRACHGDQFRSWMSARHARSAAEPDAVGAAEWTVELVVRDGERVVGDHASHTNATGEAQRVAIAERADLATRHWARPGASFAQHCADCHHGGWSASGHDAQSLEVSCESCHGPGAAHADWGKARMMGRDAEDPLGTKGWTRQLFAADYASWTADPETGNPPRRDVPHARTQVETCLRCHSANDGWLTDRVQEPTSALDARIPRFGATGVAVVDDAWPSGSDALHPGRTADLDAVAAFATSPMHAAGVACTDCHDPHASRLYATDDLLCLRCHEGASFDSAEHHRHPAEAKPSCVDCHMPPNETGVPHHGLRKPGSSLANWLGQPDGCAHCHADWTTDRLAQARRDLLDEMRGGAPPIVPLEIGLTGSEGARPRGGEVAASTTTLPAVLRGVGAAMVARDGEAERIAPLLADEEAYVRLGALRGLAGRDLDALAAALTPLATDEHAAVRVTLGRLLEPLDPEARAALFGDAAPAIEAVVEEARRVR